MANFSSAVSKKLDFDMFSTVQISLRKQASIAKGCKCLSLTSLVSQADGLLIRIVINNADAAPSTASCGFQNDFAGWTEAPCKSQYVREGRTLIVYGLRAI